jgi:hypothetical protein
MKESNEELHNLYSQNIIVIESRKIKSVERVPYVGKMRNAYKILIIKPNWKRPLGRLLHRCGDSNKMHLKEIGCESVDWIQLA